MNLHFSCSTNAKEVYVNTANFTLKSGSVLTIDRKMTEYSVIDGRLEMDWYDCYLWAIDDENIFGDDEAILKDTDAVSKLLSDAPRCELNIEDDAPKNYVCQLCDWQVCY